MGEIKSVKVDNWGVFFLQKLQNFFNKTDYCDLTLQFRDNSQLKVHRLVLSACTDYFNVLEQTCEVVDDAIIMPNGLQADVVVPIVNFMYTGTLEFELKMYGRLLRTAKDMNMTVLLKLLEAHRRTMEMHPQKSSAPASPKARRRAAAQSANTNLPTNAAGGRSLIQTGQNKRLVVSNTGPQRTVSAGHTVQRLPTAGPLPVRQIGSTTFTRIKVENDHQETNTPAGGGYTVLKQSPQQHQNQQQHQQPTSPFEQLRKGYNNNKRPAVSSFVSPPTKKPNLEDVKEFAEQQRMRKQIAAEYGDDDYDASNIMDDDTIHNDDDDDEMMTPQPSATQSQSTAVQTQNQSQQSEDPPGTTTIIVKHEGPDKPPTIVVKDNSNSKMNHAKIISEVLRQYPHLVKSNKNIKLKIMPNAGGQAQKIIVKKEPVEVEKNMPAPSTKLPKVGDNQPTQQTAKSLAASIVANRPKTLQPQQQQQTEQSTGIKANSGAAQVTAVNKTTGTAATSTAANTTAAAAAPPQKRRIDSKTMHALIALGAENTTGPWLCLRCGRNGHPISIPSYRGFRRHLINTHKEFIDPALCEHCGWRSSGKRELHFHMQVEHKVRTNLYIFPECQLCQQLCIDSDGLNEHLIDSHPDENKQQCIYCNKIFPEEIQLYTHMKTFHKKQALSDGIIDYSDDENQGQTALPLPPSSQYDQEHEEKPEKKINILSDISLPIASSIVKTDSFVQQHQQQQESTTSAASDEYLQQSEEHAETKFVAADGSEVILTAEQRKEILSQLNQEHEGSNVVMVLNENQQQQQEQQSEQGAISHDETSQATTATNDEREQEEPMEEDEDAAEEHAEQHEEGEEEEEQHDDNEIYREMKALQSNLEDDSTSQTEAATETAETAEHEQVDEDEEHESVEQDVQRVEHLDESKESVDNLEWAENLISEHDLADEVSSQTTNENLTNEKELKDDDNKSQDEISKKLKELTGDWSEDDEDMPDEEPLPEISPTKEIAKAKTEDESAKVTDVEMQETLEKDDNKEAERLTKEQEDNIEFEDHAELLASLQSNDKEETQESKEITNESAVAANVEEDVENIDEDDIDMALKSLHKEDIEEINTKTEVEEEKPEKEVKSEDDKIEKKECEIKVETSSSSAVEQQEEMGDNETEKEEVDVKKDNEVVSKVDEEISNIKEEEEKPEEKLAKEIETMVSEEPEASSSTVMEVDEDIKKDLIDSLLSEQAETMEDTATETQTNLKIDECLKEALDKVAGEIETLEETNTTDKESKTKEEEDKTDKALPDELGKVENEEISSSVDTKTTTISSSSSSSITPAATTEVAEASSTSNKDDAAAITSEERVKSLISEWGDDDEDDDDNDADLTANL
ncbi:centrosome-associated zinc finger protein CP190 isoform 2-T2 [Cochliomyia hominivorax]